MVRNDCDPVTRLVPAAYKALSPSGLPVITDNGLNFADSCAIIDYIMAKHSDGRLDVMILFSLTTVGEFVPLDLSPYRALCACLRRVIGRHAFQAAKRWNHSYVRASAALKAPG